ncbi:MAG: hypothetical protein H6799_00675 [Candidatus Nomurabacteria bacterium]|nr:MAG: hypothetical protein H6799_00675 [Candidatus Nomurabacteria bacterium]HRV75895.1 hypothetical protein [Candidatus Saccharimonadales bacterium]
MAYRIEDGAIALSDDELVGSIDKMRDDGVSMAVLTHAGKMVGLLIPMTAGEWISGYFQANPEAIKRLADLAEGARNGSVPTFGPEELQRRVRGADIESSPGA